MDNTSAASQECISESKVMEVFYIEKDKKLMYIDYFTKNDLEEIVENFFIKGGLPIPLRIDEGKTLKQLTEKDYTIFFEELGYEVTGFNKYDKHIHHAYTVPFPNDISEETIES